MAIQFDPNALGRFSNVNFGDNDAIANRGIVKVFRHITAEFTTSHPAERRPLATQITARGGYGCRQGRGGRVRTGRRGSRCG